MIGLRLALVAVVIGAAAASAEAQHMPVSTFLTKAEALEKKGPMALFSGDLKLLKGEISRASAELRAERRATIKSGKAAAYCPPDKGKLDSDELLRSFRTIPPAERPGISTKEGLRRLMIAKYPCRG